MDNIYYQYLDSPVGQLLIVADEEHLLSCQFSVDRAHKKKSDNSKILDHASQELTEYFDGKLKSFTTHCKINGTTFQNLIWNELKKIPYGQVISYKQLAAQAGHVNAYRAAGSANGLNDFVIFLPCHRVINSNGDLGGYTAGVSKKTWLLEHEKKHYKIDIK